MRLEEDPIGKDIAAGDVEDVCYGVNDDPESA